MSSLFTGIIKFYKNGQQSGVTDDSLPPGSVNFVNHYYIGRSETIPHETRNFYVGPHEMYTKVLTNEEIYYAVYLREIPDSSGTGCQ